MLVVQIDSKQYWIVVSKESHECSVMSVNQLETHSQVLLRELGHSPLIVMETCPALFLGILSTLHSRWTENDAYSFFRCFLPLSWILFC